MERAWIKVHRIDIDADHREGDNLNQMKQNEQEKITIEQKSNEKECKENSKEDSSVDEGNHGIWFQDGTHPHISLTSVTIYSSLPDKLLFFRSTAVRMGTLTRPTHRMKFSLTWQQAPTYIDT